jgi:hypothetical protein
MVHVARLSWNKFPYLLHRLRLFSSASPVSKRWEPEVVVGSDELDRPATHGPGALDLRRRRTRSATPRSTFPGDLPARPRRTRASRATNPPGPARPTFASDSPSRRRLPCGGSRPRRPDQVPPDPLDFGQFLSYKLASYHPECNICNVIVYFSTFFPQFYIQYCNWM